MLKKRQSKQVASHMAMISRHNRKGKALRQNEVSTIMPFKVIRDLGKQNNSSHFTLDTKGIHQIH